MTKEGFKKIFTIFFAVCLVLGLMPGGLYAQAALADTVAENTEQSSDVEMFAYETCDSESDNLDAIDDSAVWDEPEEPGAVNGKSYFDEVVDMPAETQAVEEQAAGRQAAQTREAETQTTEAQAVETQTTVAQSTETREAEVQAVEEQSSQANIALDTQSDEDIVVLSAGIMPLASSGTCGDNLTWTLDNDGVLTISGTGDMDDVSQLGSAPWNSVRTSIVKIVIEEGVTSIGYGAFYNCTAATEASIASSVTAIGRSAFRGCTALTTIGSLPKDLTEIGSYAFYGCSKLAGTLTVPEGVTVIEDDTFYNCKLLEGIELQGAVVSIGIQVFYGCTGLTEVILPDTVTSIGGYLFYQCSNLVSATIPASVTDFDTRYTFYQCSSLTYVEILCDVTDFGSQMFYKCAALTDIEIPNSVETIGQSAFQGCTSLEAIELSENLTSMDASIFYDCAALKYIELPAGITAIPNQTFRNCTSLEKAEALGTITSIGMYAFRDCFALIDVFDLSQVSEMETYAFYDCNALVGPVDLSSLDAVPDYAFTYNDSLTGVTFSDTLTSIGTWGFCRCYEIASLELPKTLASIGSYAFWYCALDDESMIATTTVDAGAAVITRTGEGDTSKTADELTYTGYTVVIPDSVTSIASNAFLNTNAEVFVVGTGLTNFDGSVFGSTALQAVVIDNFKNNVTVSNQSALWGSLSGSAANNNVAVVYRDGAIAEDETDIVSLDVNNPFYNMTLQEAVDAVAAGEMEGPITITKDVVLSETVVVPAGEAVAIITEGDWKLTGRSSGIETLITVAEGADLTLGSEEAEGNLTLYGNWKSDITSMITVNGSFTLKDGITITKGSASSSGRGIIYVSGGNAVFTMAGGVIEGNTIEATNCATVLVTNGASFYMTDGTIQNNTSTAVQEIGGSSTYGVCVASSGVLLSGFATGEMSGGIIQNNYSFNGSAIYLYSESGDVGDYPVTFTISGGTITGNESPVSANASGAVMVEGNASLVMCGGEISENYGRNGGAIAVLDAFNSANPNGVYTTRFIMEGGTISNNSATNGGGIYSYSDGVYLKAGTIADNSASLMGGGIYGEGNTTYYTYLHLTNAYVANNEASNQGGGMWFCPTGIAEIYVTNGGTIVNNAADRAGDDLVFAANYAGEEDTELLLSERILGGGKVNWYCDGMIYTQGNGNMYPGVSGNAPRWGADNYDEWYDNGGLVDYGEPITTGMAIKAFMEDEAVTFALTQSSLFITDNTATFGGGVGANGGMVLGENTDLTEIEGAKTWDDADNQDGIRPDEITIHLVANVTIEGEDLSYILETKTITAEDNWEWQFGNLPMTDEEGHPLTYTYTIEEDSIPGYTPVYDGYNIINTHTAEVTGVSGTKTWDDSEDQDGARPTSITVRLWADGEEISSIEVTADDDWQYSFTDLPRYAGGVEITYTVTEDAVDGYTTEIDGFDITNTYIPEIPDTVDIAGSKTWVDDDDEEGKRPESITVHLYADDEEIDTVTVTAEDGWSWGFEGLAKYSDDETEIVYTVAEDAVEGYEAEVDGYNITNTYIPEEPDNPGDDNPGDDEPTGGNPGDETPGDDIPGDEPKNETPGDETPGGNNPSDETPNNTIPTATTGSTGDTGGTGSTGTTGTAGSAGNGSASKSGGSSSRPLSQTGDPTPFMPVIAVIVLAGIGATAAGLRLRRRG